MNSLLFNFLDESLFLFCDGGFTMCYCEVLSLDRERWAIRCRVRGEKFDLARHEQGTEVKAITYSNMQVIEKGEDGQAHIYVIVDI
jgi:SHS2 domain-containing protein